MNSVWPLEARDDDETALPPPWDGDVDFSDQQSESALLALQHRQPMLALRICRRVFCRTEARGDKRASLHALHLACVILYNSSQREPADRMFDMVRQRAQGIDDVVLGTRIELNHARRLSDDGEHAQAMVINQRVLAAGMASGDTRLIYTALTNLALSASHAGDAELVMSVCQQQLPLLTDDDVVIAGQRSARANTVALAWMKIAHSRQAASDHAAAHAALLRASEQAKVACESAHKDSVALYCLETLVQILLRLDEIAEARNRVDRCTARLDRMPVVGSEDWCMLELSRTRIELHDGRFGTQTREKLQQIEASTARISSEHPLLQQIREVLLKAQEQTGDHEQALATHKRSTEWHARRHSAQSRQRMKILRHTVLAMRAEAVEFITHDLLTPLAAAQMWLQALLGEPLPAVVATPLRDVHRQLGHGATLADRYLGLWRAELTPRDHLQVLDLGALVDDVCENFMPPSAAGPVRLERELHIGACIRGDRTLLTRALAVLLQHVFERAEVGTPVRLRLSTTAVGAAGKAMLSIHYRGENVSASLRTRIHHRFADGAPVHATALHWLLVTRIAQLHRARLRFQTAPIEGCSVQLSFALSGLLHNDANL
jgi:signal transduction histidine kinase